MAFKPIGYTNAESSNFGAYDQTAIDAANQAQINPNWFVQLIQNESAFNPNAQNPGSSAGGIGQFIDGTANLLGIDKWNPTQALYAAAAYVGGLYNLYIDKGYTSDQAYAKAAQSYGDTAKNNPNASVFQSRLQSALGSPAVSPVQNLQTGLDGMAQNFQTGWNAVTSDPFGAAQTYGGILATGTNAAITNPLGSASTLVNLAGSGAGAVASGVSDGVTGAVKSAGQSVQNGLNTIGGAITGATAPITSLFNNNTLERTVFIVLGVLLLAAALFTLVKSYGPPPAAIAAMAA